VASDSGAYIPSAGGSAPAHRADLISLDCDFEHVALSVHSAKGPFSISTESENPSVLQNSFVTTTTRKPGSDFCRVVLNPEWIENLPDEGTVKLPVLQDIQRIWFPKTVCLADASGKCQSASPDFASLQDGDRYFSSLRLSSGWKGRLGTSFIQLSYERRNHIDNSYPPEPPVDYRWHPGENRYFHERINESLAEEIHKAGSDMQTLVEKLWFADCDMTALATAQADAKKGTTTKIVLGNRPITPRILDVQSKNHAWNVRSEQDRDHTFKSAGIR
jgi:hypothetical protein